jgi:lysophospholipase L1-like esterase
MPKARNVIGTTALLFVSTAIALVACEFVARFFLDPVDYLKPPLVDDDVLGHRIEPGSGGHDEWGFRNKNVPESCDIVAIGDSQTYGIGAASTDAWPATLAELTGRTTYNLSLGGYGPVHYLHLLEEKGLGLSPTLVIVGLYYGNDLHEAFGATYHIDHWKWLRTPEMSARQDSVRAARAERPQPRRKRAGGWRGGVLSVREWFSRRSVVYRAVFEVSPLGRVLRISQTRFVPDEDATILDDPESGIRTAFALAHRREGIDLSQPTVREGVRIAQEVFRRMHDTATSNGAEFVVAILPSKPLVYARYIEHNETLDRHELIDAILADERRIDAMMKASFDEHGIRYIDTLPALQEAVAGEPLYPANANSHPNKNGYAVIARTIQSYIESN